MSVTLGRSKARCGQAECGRAQDPPLRHRCLFSRNGLNCSLFGRAHHKMHTFEESMYEEI